MISWSIDEMTEPRYNCDLAFFSYFFPPETGAAAVRLGEFAKGLSELGRKLEVLAPMPNYPSGKIYKNYPGLSYHRELWNGINVLRVPLIPPKGQGGARRMLSYLTFNLSAEWAKTFLLNARPGAVFFSSPPVPAILPALRMAKRRRVPFILDVRDLWPEIAVALGLMREGSFIHRYLSGIVRHAYHAASAIIVTTHGDADAVAKWGIDPGRIKLIPNGANTEIFRPDENARREIRTKLGIGDDLVVVYSGSFGRGMNDLDTLLETAFLLREAKGVRFLLVGEGDKHCELKEQASKRNISNITYIPSQPSEELNGYLNAADIGFIPRRELACDTGGNVPVKMFEYMAVGLPVLLTSIPGCEAERIHRDSGSAGAWFPPGDAKKASEWIYEAKGNSDKLKTGAKGAREFVLGNYNRAGGVRKLNDILSEVLGEDGPDADDLGTHI
jgi:glycosyltransferase involved in cell wall biosynthesis